MRLFTHTDLDGIACAILLLDMEEIEEIHFIDPESIEKINIKKWDIISDLPYRKGCHLWFDHHKSNEKNNMNFKGSFKIEKSAARVIYDYYDNPYLKKYDDFLKIVDEIDSGNIKKQDVLNPTGFVLLSLTLESENEKKIDDEYRKKIIDMIRKDISINQILQDKEVKKRADNAVNIRKEFKKWCEENIYVEDGLAICDCRGKKIPKAFSNFLIYLSKENILVSIKITDDLKKPDTIKLSVGKNNFKEKIDLDISKMLKKYGGGGHRDVGGASIQKEDFKIILEQIKESIKESIKKYNNK